MSQATSAALKELQRLDREIKEAEKRSAAFGPQLDDVDGPALQLEAEAAATKTRLTEMKLDERRHELFKKLVVDRVHEWCMHAEQKLKGRDVPLITATGNDVEWMMYGWSILHCLPVGMTDENAVGTGTVMRTDTLRQYAKEAGFSKVEVLPIEHFFFRFYRLTP